MLEVALALLLTADRVELVFGGDVIPHTPVKHVAAEHARWTRPELGEQKQSLNHLGWDHVFGPLAQSFHGCDIAVVNLETPISGDPKAKTAEMLFDAPVDLLNGLQAAGVTVATFANNHCLDQHREGITATRKALETAKLLSVGADQDEERAWTPLILEKNGIRVGLLGFTRQLNGFKNKPDPMLPHVPLVHYPSEPQAGGDDENRLLERVRAAAAKCDALILLPHWGNEYAPVPRHEDRALARRLIEAGALAVIGSHPHVLQPLQTVDRPDGSQALIAFSLGNLVSNQDMSEPESPKREGLLLKLTLGRSAAGMAVQLVRVAALPVWTENVLRAGERRNVQPMILEDELSAMSDRLATLGSREDPASVAERKALSRRLAAAQTRRIRILRGVPVELLRAE